MNRYRTRVSTRVQKLRNQPSWLLVCMVVAAMFCATAAFRAVLMLCEVIGDAYAAHGYAHWAYPAALALLAGLVCYGWCANVVFLYCQRELRYRFTKWARM
jgi:hypothetical protein